MCCVSTDLLGLHQASHNLLPLKMLSRSHAKSNEIRARHLVKDMLRRALAILLMLLRVGKNDFLDELAEGSLELAVVVLIVGAVVAWG